MKKFSKADAEWEVWSYVVDRDYPNTDSDYIPFTQEHFRCIALDYELNEAFIGYVVGIYTDEIYKVVVPLDGSEMKIQTFEYLETDTRPNPIKEGDDGND